MGKLNYCNGMNKHSCDKIARFLFGDFFREVKVDAEARMFHIIVNEFIINENKEKTFFKDTYDKNYREYFQSYWGTPPGFNIKVVEPEKEKDIDSEE